MTTRELAELRILLCAASTFGVLGAACGTEPEASKCAGTACTPGSGGQVAGGGGGAGGSGGKGSEVGGSSGEGSGGSGAGAGGSGNAGSGGTSGDGDGGESVGGGAGSSATLGFDVALAGLLDGDSTAWEQARDVVIDDEGSIYVVGGTSSPNFPTTSGAYDTTYATGGSQLGSQGATDAFVTKMDSNGQIVWSTYLGGPNYDRAYAVRVDAAHEVYVAGRAGSGFPTTSGVVQETFAGDDAPNGPYGSQDGFIAKLSADGADLLWSTYFGDAGPGFIRDIDLDDMNRVHVAATAISDMDGFVTNGAAQPTRRGDFDAFYARLSADGTTVEYGTYLGGNDSNGYYSGNPAIRVHTDGTAHFLAIEPGSGAPTTSGVFQPGSGGGIDLLVAKFSTSGQLDFCTYLGGSGDEEMDTHSLALTPQGEVVVGAFSDSGDYPVTDGSRVTGAIDAIISTISSDGASLVHSTVIGGTGSEGIEGITVGPHGRIYATGFTSSSNLPVTEGALDSSYGGSLEGFLLVLPPDLASPLYLSYDGIPGEYGNRSSTVGSDGTWAVVGSVWNLDPFPATNGQDSTIDGQHAGFFLVLAEQ